MAAVAAATSALLVGSAAGAASPSPAPDTTPPVIHAPLHLKAAATSATGAVVSYQVSATDRVDGPVIPLCMPAPQTKFPLGVTNVTCAAHDAAGNTSSKQFTVTVGYRWSGLLAPVNTDGTSVFKLGTTVPLRFALRGPSHRVKRAIAYVHVTKVSNTVGSGALETPSKLPPEPINNPFRYVVKAQRYAFNLDTKRLTAGTYQLTVDLGDGVLRTQQISLRKVLTVSASQG